MTTSLSYIRATSLIFLLHFCFNFYAYQKLYLLKYTVIVFMYTYEVNTAFS